MRTVLALLVLLAATSGRISRGGEWLTAPSFYTHDPYTGQRTSQYAAAPRAAIPQTASFRSSGYTHVRSSIQVGQSADHYHRVEQWGPPVRPYGEWRFPYRPYSVPYPEWGAPLAGLNLGGFPYGYPGGGYPGGGHPGGGHPGGGHPGTGHHPSGHPGDGTGHGGGYPHGGGYQPPLPYQPYPSGPHSPYPVPPYADGYYPSVPFRPRLPDRQFYWKPNQDPPQTPNP